MPRRAPCATAAGRPPPRCQSHDGTRRQVSALGQTRMPSGAGPGAGSPCFVTSSRQERLRLLGGHLLLEHGGEHHLEHLPSAQQPHAGEATMGVVQEADAPSHRSRPSRRLRPAALARRRSPIRRRGPSRSRRRPTDASPGAGSPHRAACEWCARAMRRPTASSGRRCRDSAAPASAADRPGVRV